MLDKKSYTVLISIILFQIGFGLYEIKDFNHNWDSKPMTWDVAGHYMYLPCIHYDDIFKLNNFKTWVLKHNINGGDEQFYQAYLNPKSGNYVLKYPIGMSIMYAPAFYVAKLFDNEKNKSGFTYPYSVAIYLWSIIFCCIGLIFTRKNLLFFFKDSVVAVALIILFFGTNYLMYSTISGSFSHGYLFTLYSIIILCCIQIFEKNEVKFLPLLAGIIALCTITRPTDILIVLVPFMWMFTKFKKVTHVINFLKSNTKIFLTSIFIFSSIISIQLLYWKLSSGNFITWSYEKEEGFQFLKPFFKECFFSYKKGWFVYTPLMIFALIGFVFLYKQHKKLFWNTIIFCAINIWVLFSWKTWWYGGSFSMRAVIQMYAILVFPLCAFIQFVSNKKLLKYVFFLIFSIGIYLNLIMIWQIRYTNYIDTESMTKAYFWKILGKTEVPSKYKLLMDNEDYRSEREIRFFSDISSDNFDILPAIESVDSSKYFSMPNSLNLNRANMYSKKTICDLSQSDWIQVSFMAHCNEFRGGDKAICSIILKSGNKIIKRCDYNFMRIMDFGTWTKIDLDVAVPKESKVNNIEVIINKSVNNTPINIDNFVLKRS